MNIFNQVDEKFYKEFDKIFKKTFLFFLIFLYIMLLPKELGVDESKGIILIKVLLIMYYLIFFLMSMNLLANLKYDFQVWFNKYKKIKISQYIFFLIWALYCLYLSYELSNDFTINNIVLLSFNIVCLEIYYKYWDELDDNFHIQWGYYIPR